MRLATVEDLIDEVERIVAAERAGTLRRTGNWTAGQTLGHLAAWIEYAYEGYPEEIRVPWFVRIVARMIKGSFLRKTMQPGFRFRQMEAGTFGIHPLSTEEGARRLRLAASRLQSREPARHDSPMFGRLTDDERIALNLRHAELHLGFLWP